jgi:adenylate kinase family enzyme
MAIILEGPDNSGKTTLAKALQSAVACKYIHAGGPPANQRGEQDCLAKQQSMFSYPDAVLDRVTCISQSVYNPDETMEPIRRTMRAHLSSSGAILVFCRPSTDRLMRTQDLTWRVDEPDDLKAKIVQNQHLFVQRYDAIMAVTPHVHYDFEDPIAANHVAELLSDVLKGRIDSFNVLKNAMHRFGGMVV